MTGEFETTGICTGTWSSSSINNMISGWSFPRSSEINGLDFSSFAWQNLDVLDAKSDMNLDSASQVSPFGSSSPATLPLDWNQSVTHREGCAEAKFNPNSFFEGLFEPHDEQSSNPWLIRTGPVLDSPVASAKSELLDSFAFFENVLFNDSGAVSVFHDIDIGAKSEEEDNQARNNLTYKRSDEKTEDFEGFNNDESPRLKRPRIETPSSLPSFKVRKEKLGDRITALQQLVSPFGKTDTASVLNEAVEYIKFLHEQVTVLSNPCMKSGGSVQQQQSSDKEAKEEGERQALRSRGLCLMPISTTFTVAAQMNTLISGISPFVLH